MSVYTVRKRKYGSIVYHIVDVIEGRRKLFLVGGGAEIEIWRPSRALQVRDFIGEIF